MNNREFASDFTFLTSEQIFGDNQLDILKKYGTKCAITDFSILLGGVVASDVYVSTGISTKDYTGYWWTKTPDNCGDALIIDLDGELDFDRVDSRDVGARPALPYSSISANAMRRENGILEVEYGEYPQTVVSEEFANTLEKAYSNKTINKTWKSYTTDHTIYRDRDISFQARTHIEYEYDGKKYIRFVGDLNGNEQILSDGRKIQIGEVYWVEVEPIKWMIDERENIALSKNILFSGVQFNRTRGYTGEFDKTDIKVFMNAYFSKDIIPSYLQEKQQEESNSTKTDTRKNPYGFNFDKVSEEDIIKGAVESNIAVFLHGRSSEGKSARVKQLDPDCEIIYLRNATPESLNGKSVYNSETGEMIDVKPTWLVKLEEKCEKEKDKIHILFFDEITNALPSIQGMAFNIVLDKEVNGKWKLPENARIVAAGNDLNDSLAANTMAEPLFNRFAHVYINTTVESWLAWASTPKEKYERLDYEENEPEMKIHPSIYAYISYKASRGEDVLRTEYNGEKPNADPRKWEMASKMLYSTKSPEMLRALIGEDLTTDFTEFCRYRVITVDDVIKGNYTERDLEMNIAEKSATSVGLSVVDEENLEVVREFVSKLGAEVLAIFDNLWIKGDEKRLERIAELRTNLTEGGKRR